MKRNLVSIAFWTFFATSSVLCFVVALVLWIVSLPFDPDRRLNHLFSCAWGSLYLKCYPGWRITISGRENIRKDRPYVLVANHASLADVVLSFGLFRQFKWVSKESIFRVPIIGWNMRLSRYIPLLRGNPNSVKLMLETCQQWLNRGISVFLFPEGTRSPNGQVRAFKMGAFHLAWDNDVAVIPIAIHGTDTIIPKHGKAMAAQAKLHVEVLAPLAPHDFDSPSALSQAARARICEALGQPVDADEEPKRPLLPRNSAAPA